MKLFNGVREGVEQEADRLMRLWGSAGRAAEVLEQCHRWQGVEYVLRFNLPDIDAEEEAMITRRGHKLLSQIPGVREVVVAEAYNDSATPHYCWQLRLASAEAVESLKKHPDFLSFNRRYLRDEATELSSASYREQQVA